jgi:tetratricopeptide (TPR) repeat protein
MMGVDEASTLPYLLELLAVKDSGIDKSPMSPEERKNRILEAIKRINIKGSEIRPLIAAFEDLHWIDKSSEDHLKHLLASIPGARILLIFTYRPEFVQTWGAKSYHSQITLSRLSNRESLMMVSHLLGTEELDKDLEEFVLEKTEGIPFFIEELIKSLKDLKIIERKNKRYRITKDIKEVTIPATVQDMIMARVDSLLEEIKSLLQTASAVGRESSYDLIKQITGLGEQELLPQLSVLKDSELLYERGIYPQSSYVFKHALTQEVAYNSLLQKRKKKIHAGIGSAMEDLYQDRLEEHYEMLAYHYGRSANADKAMHYLDLANQKAIRLNALEEAKAYFEEAMTHLDTLPDNEDNRQRRISLLVNQGEVFLLLAKFSEYYDLLTRYEPMAMGLGNQALLGALYSRTGFCDFEFGHYDHGIKRLTKAAELCEAAGNIEDTGYAYVWLGWNHLFAGHYDQVLAVYVRGVCAASRACICLGRWDEAVEEAQKALKAAEESADNSLVNFAAWTLSMAYTWRGDLGRGVEYGELALQKAVSPAEKDWAQRGLGWALCRAGEATRGVELLAAALQDFQTGHRVSGLITTTCTLGAGYWLAGENDKARQTLEEGLEIADRCGARYYVGWAHRFLGEIALKANPARAASHFEKSIAVLQEINAENALALAYAGYGRIQKQQGQIAQAREYLTKALQIFERLGTLIEPDKVREILAELPAA